MPGHPACLMYSSIPARCASSSADNPNNFSLIPNAALVPAPAKDLASFSPVGVYKDASPAEIAERPKTPTAAGAPKAAAGAISAASAPPAPIMPGHPACLMYSSIPARCASSSADNPNNFSLIPNAALVPAPAKDLASFS